MFLVSSTPNLDGSLAVCSPRYPADLQWVQWHSRQLSPCKPRRQVTLQSWPPPPVRVGSLSQVLHPFVVPSEERLWIHHIKLSLFCPDSRPTSLLFVTCKRPVLSASHVPPEVADRLAKKNTKPSAPLSGLCQVHGMSKHHFCVFLCTPLPLHAPSCCSASPAHIWSLHTTYHCTHTKAKVSFHLSPCMEALWLEGEKYLNSLGKSNFEKV